MTSATRSTPISAMETVTGLQPVEDRQEIKELTHFAKFKRLQDHPMHERMNQPTRRRLKRSSFIQHSRILERKKSWAAWPYVWTSSISQNHPILETKTTPKNMHKSARGHRQRLSTWAKEEVTEAGVYQHQVPRRPVHLCLHRRLCIRHNPRWGWRGVRQVQWWKGTHHHSHR